MSADSEPFVVVLRQGYIVISAVLESRDDITEFRRAFTVAAIAHLDAIDAIATEARRAETPKSGSVHEGAGPQDIAQKETP